MKSSSYGITLRRFSSILHTYFVQIVFLMFFLSCIVIGVNQLQNSLYMNVHIRHTFVKHTPLQFCSKLLPFWVSTSIFLKVNHTNTIQYTIRRLTAWNNTTDLKQLIGIDQINHTVYQIVASLRRWNRSYTRAYLIIGSVGTGKTLLTKSIAASANVHLICSTLSELQSSSLTSGPAHLRMLFQQAKLDSPCVISLENLELIAQKRNSTHLDIQLFTELLVGLSFKTAPNVFIGTTTNITQLDRALIRPGRINRIIQLNKPTKTDRFQFLQSYAGKFTHYFVRQTNGFTQADLACLCDTAYVVHCNTLVHQMVRSAQLVPLVLQIVNAKPTFWQIYTAYQQVGTHNTSPAYCLYKRV